MAPHGKSDWTYLPVAVLPRMLDIVWCRFPEGLPLSVPGPKSRPALVRAIKFNKLQTKARIEVTYGTSNLKVIERPFDLIIENMTDCYAMGLPQATRFDLDNTVELPWAAEYFEAREGYGSPIIGHLTQSSCMQLVALTVARRTQR